MIKLTDNISGPPDFEEWFDERGFYYCQFGLMAYQLSNELAQKYGIKKKVYNNWNPITDLQRKLEMVSARRQKRIERHTDFVNNILKAK